jgi:60 kDa SS-A/Ro ribonucleoprotein
MPMTALIRNLATMTRVGVARAGLGRHGDGRRALGDAERIRRARVHPIAVLAALRTYASGRGVRGRGEWTRCARSSTRSTPRSTRRSATSSRGQAAAARARRVRLDGVRRVAGVPGLTPRDASAALALVTAATEPTYEVVGFFAGTGGCKAGRAGSGTRRRRPDAAARSPAAAARRRRAAVSTCRSAAPTARCRCCTRRRERRSTRS